MTKQELTKAFEIARYRCAGLDTVWNDRQRQRKLSGFKFSELDVFDGFGLPNFKPRLCRLEDIAALIMYQCQRLDGGWDLEALSQIGHYGKRNFLIVG